MDGMPIMLDQNKKISLLVSIACALVVTFWSFVVPMFEFPDEQAHFSTVEFLAKNDRIPVGLESDMTEELKETEVLLGVFRNASGQNKFTYHPQYRATYLPGTIGLYEPQIISFNSPDFKDSYVATEAARYPRAYYDYSGFLNKLVNSQDIIMRLFVTRLGSFVLSFATAYFIFQAGLLLFKKYQYAATLTIMVMLQPMFSFVSAGINSDNLHNLLFTIGIYLSLLIIEKGFSLGSLLLLAATLALDVYSKPQGVFVTCWVAIFIRAIVSKNIRLLVALIVFAILGALLTKTALSPYLGFLNVANIHGSSFKEFLNFSINKSIAQNAVWYWGVFKWLGVVLPPIYWRVANRLVLLGAVGIFIYLYKYFKKKKSLISMPSMIFLISSFTIYTFSIFWFDWQHNKLNGYSLGIQARYFYPTILAQMSLLMTGILSFSWNKTSKIWLRRILVLLFIWLQLGGIFTLLNSYYNILPVSDLISQLSQYKPFFAKGNIWYLWTTIYLSSISMLIYLSLKSKSEK
jgi:hypothetical protein